MKLRRLLALVLALAMLLFGSVVALAEGGETVGPVLYIGEDGVAYDSNAKLVIPYEGSLTLTPYIEVDGEGYKTFEEVMVPENAPDYVSTFTYAWSIEPAQADYVSYDTTSGSTFTLKNENLDADAKTITVSLVITEHYTDNDEDAEKDLTKYSVEVKVAGSAGDSNTVYIRRVGMSPGVFNPDITGYGIFVDGKMTLAAYIEYEGSVQRIDTIDELAEDFDLAYEWTIGTDEDFSRQLISSGKITVSSPTGATFTIGNKTTERIGFPVFVTVKLLEKGTTTVVDILRGSIRFTLEGFESYDQESEVSSENEANRQAEEAAIKAVEAAMEAISEGKTPAKVQNVTTAAGATIPAVSVKLYGVDAYLSVDSMETMADASVGLQVNLDNGAAEILIPGGFPFVDEPMRMSYLLGYKKDPYNTDLMKSFVRTPDAKTEVYKLGGGTLPTTATVTLKTKLTGPVNIYRWDEDTRRVTLLTTATAENGKVIFGTKQLGNLIITTGTI